jgi:hypothetical protein
MLDEGVGYNQYDPFLPHARYKHAGVPLTNTTFVFFGGCARYRMPYTLGLVMPLSSRINVI